MNYEEWADIETKLMQGGVMNSYAPENPVWICLGVGWEENFSKVTCSCGCNHIVIGRIAVIPTSSYGLGLADCKCGRDPKMHTISIHDVRTACPRCGASLSSGTTPKDSKWHCPSCGAFEGQ